MFCLEYRMFDGHFVTGRQHNTLYYLTNHEMLFAGLHNLPRLMVIK